MSIKLYVLGGPRYKPSGVSRGSPRLHFIIMFMLMKLFVCCCDRNKVQFNSKEADQFIFGAQIVSDMNRRGCEQLTARLSWCAVRGANHMGTVYCKLQDGGDSGGRAATDFVYIYVVLRKGLRRFSRYHSDGASCEDYSCYFVDAVLLKPTMFVKSFRVSESPVACRWRRRSPPRRARVGF